MYMYLYYMYLKINSLTKPKTKPKIKIPSQTSYKNKHVLYIYTGVWPILDSYLIFKAYCSIIHI